MKIKLLGEYSINIKWPLTQRARCIQQGGPLPGLVGDHDRAWCAD